MVDCMTLVKELKEYFKAYPTFSIRDIKIFCDKKRVSKQYIFLLIHNLLKRHELKKITRGKYTFQDDIQVVGFAFHPFYYGLQDSLSLRNLWEQETIPIIITPRKVRAGIRKFANGNYLVRRINRNMFFGYETIKYKNFWIPVSDLEKTLIDFIYFKEPISSEVIEEMKTKIDRDKLKSYLKKCPIFVQKRIKKLIDI